MKGEITKLRKHPKKEMLAALIKAIEPQSSEPPLTPLIPEESLPNMDGFVVWMRAFLERGGRNRTTSSSSIRRRKK